MQAHLRPWAAAALMLVLGGCAYPKLNRTTQEYQVRAVTVDARFPALRVYQECTDACGKSDAYTFAHFDEKSDGPAQSVTRGEQPRFYTGPAGNHLVPSYSWQPKVRVLDSFRTTSGGQRGQAVALYRPDAVDGRHDVTVALPWTACPALSRNAPWSVPQPVRFAAVVRGAVVLFVDVAQVDPSCADLRPADVLGSGAGLPAELAQRAFVAYVVRLDQGADVAIAPVRATRGGCRTLGTCVDAAKGEALSADPVPETLMAAVRPNFVCRERHASTDWVLYAGMVATRKGAVSATKACAALP